VTEIAQVLVRGLREQSKKSLAKAITLIAGHTDWHLTLRQGVFLCLAIPFSVVGLHLVLLLLAVASEFPQLSRIASALVIGGGDSWNSWNSARS
jgi:hypothetical protein